MVWPFRTKFDDLVSYHIKPIIGIENKINKNGFNKRS